MTINLNTCVPGQKCVSKDGKYLTYLRKLDNIPPSFAWYHHLLLDEQRSNFTFTNDGIYDLAHPDSEYNIVRIIPMESTTSASHPSVVWWESCPWITDRKPTEKDGNYISQVMMQAPGQKGTKTTCFMDWKYVKPGQTWIHCMNWNPPKQTPKEKAMELINNHEDGWRPTPEQWHIIRKGLEAL